MLDSSRDGLCLFAWSAAAGRDWHWWRCRFSSSRIEAMIAGSGTRGWPCSMRWTSAPRTTEAAKDARRDERTEKESAARVMCRGGGVGGTPLFGGASRVGGNQYVLIAVNISSLPPAGASPVRVVAREPGSRLAARSGNGSGRSPASKAPSGGATARSAALSETCRVVSEPALGRGTGRAEPRLSRRRPWKGCRAWIAAPRDSPA